MMRSVTTPVTKLPWPALLLSSLMMVALFGLLAGCRPADDSWSRVQQSGVLRVGIDPTYPPFALGSDDGVVGLDADLAAELATELGIEPQFTYFGYDGLYDALLTGQVDVLISALVIDPDRTRDFAYSLPYYDAGQLLVLREDDDAISELDDLQGQTVAVELGALGHVEALAAARRLPGLTVTPYGSAAEAMDAVASGEARAAIIDSIGARLRLLEQTAGTPGNLRRLSPTISSEPFALVVRNEDQALLDQLNRAMQHLIDTGRLDQLIHRSVGP